MQPPGRPSQHTQNKNNSTTKTTKTKPILCTRWRDRANRRRQTKEAKTKTKTKICSRQGDRSKITKTTTTRNNIMQPQNKQKQNIICNRRDDRATQTHKNIHNKQNETTKQKSRLCNGWGDRTKYNKTKTTNTTTNNKHNKIAQPPGDRTIKQNNTMKTKTTNTKTKQQYYATVGATERSRTQTKNIQTQHNKTNTHMQPPGRPSETTKEHIQQQ